MKQKSDYKAEYLKEFQEISKIYDLTLQDVYGALIVMENNNWISAPYKSRWSKGHFEKLRKMMLDWDDFGSGLEHFKQAVKQTRFDRSHRSTKKEEEHYEDIDYSSPDNDMDYASRELLKKQDVYYEKQNIRHLSNILFERWLSENKNL